MKTYIDNSKRENLVITGINFSNGVVNIVVSDSLNGLQYQRKVTPEFIKLLAEFDASMIRQIENGIVDNQYVIDMVKSIVGANRNKAISFNGIAPE